MPIGGAQQYLAKYNGYQLPGYVQDESFDSLLNIADHYAAYIDGSDSEDTGLSNKALTLTLKVWETDYATCKQQVQLGATMLRSKRGFAPLYVQWTDKYYMAMSKSIKTQKAVGSSVRTLDYDVEFECKPWLYSISGHTITGTGTIDTDAVGRTIDNGTYTPAIVTVTGTNVTISGYTATGDFTGYISISGAVSSMVIDTEAFTATVGGVNKNNLMYSTDYRMYVGPGKTNFAITGASSCSITYYDRWAL